jgi:hypothetical protein
MGNLLFDLLSSAFRALGLILLMVFYGQGYGKRGIAFFAKIVIGGHN